MKRKAASRTRAGMPLETLEQVVATLNPETEPGELAAQMVCVLAAPGRLEGARLWRVVNGAPIGVARKRRAAGSGSRTHRTNPARKKSARERREIHLGAGAGSESGGSAGGASKGRAGFEDAGMAGTFPAIRGSGFGKQRASACGDRAFDDRRGYETLEFDFGSGGATEYYFATDHAAYGSGARDGFSGG